MGWFFLLNTYKIHINTHVFFFYRHEHSHGVFTVSDIQVLDRRRVSKVWKLELHSRTVARGSSRPVDQVST